MKNVKPFLLNITQQSSIENAYRVVSANAPDGLWAIVNNAGALRGNLFEVTPVSLYRNLMEVNLFGHIAVTQTLLPFVKKARGRIVNMASMAGKLAVPTMSTYCCTKFAMLAWSTCIRRELAPYGITVSLILPTWMKTPLVSTNAKEKEIQELYDFYSKEKLAPFEEFFKAHKENYEKSAISSADNPQLVVDAYKHAVLGKYPRSVYQIGNIGLLFFLLTFVFPEWFTDKIFAVKNLPVTFQ